MISQGWLVFSLPFRIRNNLSRKMVVNLNPLRCRWQYFPRFPYFFNLFLQSRTNLVKPIAALLLKWDHGSPLYSGHFLVPICHFLHLYWSRPIPIPSPLSLHHFVFLHINIYCSPYSTPFTKNPRKTTNADYLQIVIVILMATSINCFSCTVRKFKNKSPFCCLIIIL